METQTQSLPSEQQRFFLAAIVDSSKDSVVSIDFNGLITSWNKAAEDLYGYPANEAIGKNLSVIVLPEDIRQLLVNIDRIKHNKAVEIYDTIRHHKGGELINLEVVLSPVKNDQQEVIGVSTVARNITDRVKAENALRESEAKLARSNEDLLQFAHVASHDLKEPLRKIKTYCFRLEDEHKNDLPASAQSYIAKIHSATERMNSMIEGILSYSQVNADKGIFETVDLNVLIKNIEEDLELLIQQKSATIEASRLPFIQGSQVLMYQLFYNLINNALKFSKPTVPAVIGIKSEMVERSGNEYIVLLISDNGIGFEQKAAKHIFETFTRLHSKDQYEGTGLGLALCYKIVQRHGGTIEATAKPGEGATFKILLPQGN